MFTGSIERAVVEWTVGVKNNVFATKGLKEREVLMDLLQGAMTHKAFAFGHRFVDQMKEDPGAEGWTFMSGLGGYGRKAGNGLFFEP